MKYGIQTPGGMVSEFNAAHQVVQLSNGKQKTWQSLGAAERWLTVHADAGYGLQSSTAKIVEVK